MRRFFGIQWWSGKELSAELDISAIASAPHPVMLPNLVLHRNSLAQSGAVSAMRFSRHACQVVRFENSIPDNGSHAVRG